MQIPSAYTSGIQGLQGAQNDLAQATTSVAAPEKSSPTSVQVPQDTVTISAQGQSTQTQSTETQSTQALSSQPVTQTDTTSALIQADQALNQGQASAEVINVASENVGTIIDLSV
ncbi:chemotaxis protein [Shewanella donghaensis]|uniref:chemotaxis protein n=1 Tax=Shewanella donghaensis TaxID=238836 RepID=UPI0011823541|nr:chemotaxis protein [Shewanella donghaensis]